MFVRLKVVRVWCVRLLYYYIIIHIIILLYTILSSSSVLFFNSSPSLLPHLIYLPSSSVLPSFYPPAFILYLSGLTYAYLYSRLICSILLIPSHQFSPACFIGLRCGWLRCDLLGVGGVFVCLGLC